jgi:hypothetical protein
MWAVVTCCTQFLVPNDPLTAWFLKPEEREALHRQVGPAKRNEPAPCLPMAVVRCRAAHARSGWQELVAVVSSPNLCHAAAVAVTRCMGRMLKQRPRG